MPLTILPPRQSALSGFATGLGSGVSSGIGELIDRKLKNMQEQQQIRQTEESLTTLLDAKTAKAIAPLAVKNPQIGSLLVKDALESPSRKTLGEILAGAPAAAYASPTSPITPEYSQTTRSPETAQREQIMAPSAEHMLPQPQEEKPFEEKPLEEITGVPKKKINPIKRQINKLTNDINRIRRGVASGALSKKDFGTVQKELAHKEAQLMNLVISKEKAKQEKIKTANDLKDKERKYKLKKKEFLAKLSSREREEQTNEQNKIDVATKETYTDLKKKYQVVEENQWKLDRMDELNKKGYFGSLPINSFLKALSTGISGVINVNIDLTGLMTSDAQEFEKLSTDFLRGAKAIFGARVTQQEILMYLKTIPTIAQSIDGRQRVIDNMNMFNDAVRVKYDAMNKIIEENDGNRPKNLDVLIQKRTAKQLDELARKFKEHTVGAQRGTLIREIFGLSTAETSGPKRNSIDRLLGKVAQAGEAYKQAYKPFM